MVKPTKEVPFVKDWINQHPNRNNSATLFKSRKENVLDVKNIAKIYRNYKTKHFKKLLNDSIPQEDKQKISKI
ncbi:MAG: hypothetical protein WA667_22895 [Candidatus Nitrosopolaris sp.]